MNSRQPAASREFSAFQHFRPFSIWYKGRWGLQWAINPAESNQTENHGTLDPGCNFFYGVTYIGLHNY